MGGPSGLQPADGRENPLGRRAEDPSGIKHGLIPQHRKADAQHLVARGHDGLFIPILFATMDPVEEPPEHRTSPNTLVGRFHQDPADNTRAPLADVPVMVHPT